MVAQGTQRRLTTIFAADVVGYSRLIRADEEATLTALTALRDEIIAPKITGHGGRIFKLMGDGILAEFTSVVEAVRAASEIQQALVKHQAGRGDAQRIELRIGINLGDVVVDGDDLQGDGVNVASRLEGLADAGGLCIAGAVYEQIRDRIDLVFEDLGERTVKNIDRPVRVWRWSSEPAKVSDAPSVKPHPHEKPSIVVLPFDNLSGDPDQSFFSDGIADDIITDLSRYGELFVIARQSAFAFHDRDSNAHDFAQELGVGYALEGSVRRSGGRARVTAQLIEVGSRKTLWAERFNREIEDILDVQEEIAAIIVNTLVGQVSYRHYKRVQMHGATAVSAYDHVLRAQQLIWAFSQGHMAQARKEAEAAIRLEPDFARALAMLSWAHQTEGAHGWGVDPDQSFDMALVHAKAAVVADQNEPWGHCTLGIALFWRNREFARGLEESRLAVRLNPSNAHFRMIIGAHLAYMGRTEEALEELDVAMHLNPLFPSLYLIHRSRALFVSGRYEEALAQIERATSALPSHPNALALLAACYGVLGRNESAREAVQDICGVSPNFNLSFIRRTLPFAEPKDLDLLCSLLGDAGLPE